MKPLLVVVAILCISCTAEKSPRSTTIDSTDSASVTLSYATGFSITKHNEFTEVEVKQPFNGATKGFRYYLIKEGQEIPEKIRNEKVIRTPVKSIVCTSTTHIPLLDYINETEKLIGFPTTDYISSEKARALVDAGKVKDLGIDKGLNLELLVSIRPQLVMGYTMSADYGQFAKIEELGVPVVINSEYLEKHPLGRAEWIKFVAAFFDKDSLANAVFQSIEKSYLETTTLVSNVQKKPTVLSGIIYGDAWFLPGGKNYAARILDDAGCDYLWKTDSTNGYLELSFESVYDRAKLADLWIGVGPYTSLTEIAAGDHRYAKFRPFASKNVYNYDARKGAKGGNEFLELGYLRPDLILKDLVKIAHPEVMPDHQLYFHRKLE